MLEEPTMIMADGLEAHLIELELRLQVSTTRKDAAALAELLSENFREFGASGRVWNRASILAELSAETPYRIISENFECQRLSSELALLTYVCKSPTRRTLRSSLWRLEGDSWRVLFHQGTVIPPLCSGEGMAGGS
jgi:hypothetical protein